MEQKPIKNSSWFSPMYISAHGSWGYSPEFYMEKKEDTRPIEKTIFDKAIILLVNEGTFSSAEDFTVKFKDNNRGIIIKRVTGGSTGNSIAITLIENFLTAYICTKSDTGPARTTYIEKGIKPDRSKRNC